VITFKQFLEGLKDLAKQVDKHGGLYYIDLDFPDADLTGKSTIRRDAEKIADEAGVKVKVLDYGEIEQDWFSSPKVRFYGLPHRLEDLVDRYWHENKTYFDKHAKPVTDDAEIK